ncbi:MAG: calcium-binding protein, partial [Nitrospira sp.]|nr:calcium-binding protein [Nitrospira sp.]
IRAVAVFKDSAGVTERIYSAPSGEITMPFSLNENSPTGTVVGIVPITAGEVGATHDINGNNDAGGRFAVVQNGTDAQGNPLFQIVVANGGPVLLDYEAVQTPVENEYQIVVDSFNDENELFATRQFTIQLNDLANEGIPTTINWTGVTPANNALPGAGTVIGNLSTIDPDVGQTHQYQTLPGSAANFTVSPGGVVTRTGEAMAPNSTYLLHVRTTDNIGVTLDETFTIRTLANGVANIFTGTSGDDIVYGMTGNDTLNGGSGDDNLFGQGGADILNGDAGNDILSGGSGADSLNGGSGNDTLRYTIGDGIDTVLNGGADTDTIDIQANGGAQTLAVTYNGTAITNFEGNGAFTSIERFTANLGAGNDTLVYTSAAGVVVDLSTATASGFASVVGIENVTGGAGSDQLTGDTNANTLSGGTGNDTLVATVDDVRDTLDGGGNTDTANYAAYAAGLTVNLGGAAPIVVGGSGSTPANSDVLVAIENFTGGTGADSITGSGAANVLRGGDGADTLNGAGGNDQLFGEAGNDTITYVIGGGVDTVDGGADTDTLNINGQANNDVLDVIYNAVGLITVFEGSTVTGVETINVDLGGNADTISYTGSALGVTVNLATGTASGLSSIANVSHVTGTAQADILSGNSSANTLTGGDGTDTLNGEGGNDTLNGGAGDDIITYAIGSGADIVNGGTETDTLNITDGAANNQLDVIYDGTVITLLEGGAISNIEIVNADMGGASDTLSYAGSAVGVTVDLADGAGIGTASGFTQLINVSNLIGTAQADSLSGNSDANTLTGGGGDDQLFGEAGNDIFTYVIGDGADSVDGGADIDTLNINGQTNNDFLDVIYNEVGLITGFGGGTVTGVETINVNLGGNTDTISYDGSALGVTVDLADGAGIGTASGLSSIQNVSHVTGTAQADNLSGNSSVNILTGGDGIDTLNGEGGADILNGGADGDTLNGGAAADQLNGDAGADTLSGDAGNDVMNGGADGDILIGGAGADTINTGSADDDITDTIRYTATGEFGGAAETITNFDVTGIVGQVDRVQFTGALNTAYDDITNNDIFQFAITTGVAGTTTASINTFEGLLLSGLGGEGVTNANLTNATAVSNAFNAEFVLSGANGQDALLVVNATDSNNFSVWQWIQAGGAATETAAGEITLIGVFTANGDVTADSFVFG